MENANQRALLTRSHPMRLIFGNSKSERVPGAQRASFQRIMKRGATKTGRHASSAAGAVDPNNWPNPFDKRANNDKHAGNSKNRMYIIPERADYPIIRISREELRSQIQAEVKSPVETAQSEEVKHMCRNMVQETLCNVFTTKYCAATDSVNDSFFPHAESVITEMFYCEVRTYRSINTSTVGDHDKTLLGRHWSRRS